MGGGFAEDVFKVSFRAHHGPGATTQDDCNGDQLSQLSAISQVKVRPGETLPLRNLVLQSKPECPLRCSLTDESSVVDAFDSQTGDLLIKNPDTVGEEHMVTVECMSTKSTMQARMQEINISVLFAEPDVQVHQGDRCSDDEVEFRFDISDFTYMLGSNKISLSQSIEQRYTECPVTCSIDNKLIDFVELETHGDSTMSLHIYSEEASLVDEPSRIGLRCESIRSGSSKRVATDRFTVKFTPQAADCSGDTLSVNNYRSKVDYAITDPATVHTIDQRFVQSQPGCPVECTLRESVYMTEIRTPYSLFTSFNSQTGELQISTSSFDFVGTKQTAIISCESTESMQQERLKTVGTVVDIQVQDYGSNKSCANNAL